MVVRLFAPLKINLTLQVVGKRADGYHLLSSLVVFGDYGDSISIAPAPATSVTVTGDFKDNVGAVDNNLVTKAIKLCEAATNKKFSGAITIDKKIPIGGGLGGGTSDGVAVIKHLSQQWAIDPATTARLASDLGADGPALLHARPCVMTGVGENITPATLPAWFLSCHILLVWDGTFVSTKDVFATTDTIDGTENDHPPATIDLNNIQHWRNGLEGAAIALHPHLRRVKETIAANPGCMVINMTGSGGCFYALFDGVDNINRAVENLKKKNLWVQPCGLYGGDHEHGHGHGRAPSAVQ